MPNTFDEWDDDLIAAVEGLRAKGPGPLIKRINIDRDDDEVAMPDLLALLTAHNQQDHRAVRRLALALADWDFEEAPPWAGDTPPRTDERRAVVYERLRVSDDVVRRLDQVAPVATMHNTVISTMWDPWYTRERREATEFYWPHYKDHLLTQEGWPAESISALDQATTDVVQRLSDPTSDHSYQSKGLVVGYVQSGKTANFTGVIAKAVDAGYRLIIVMTGTIEMLRSQTQRRLDRELVGRENLTRGLAEESAAEFDYATDEDWLKGRFVRHGEDFLARNLPGIERMTLLHDDYRRLKQGLSRMQFHSIDRSTPFYDPTNLIPADARLVVVKKNANVLKKLAQDLKPLRDKLADIPALIIDDESDLASVNTKDPRRTADRTAINKAISELLGRLPRAQLVMYTATPFANFFVDPDDDADIFPKNFIVALDRPPGYMGVGDFHDVAWNSEDDKTDPAVSNEAAYIRAVGPPPDPTEPDELATRIEELQRALDSFVLAGAVKVYREQATGDRFRHHTMLVHEHTDTSVHRELADLVRSTWRDGGYGTPRALRRLRELWIGDFAPVSAARADGLPVPETFEDLVRPIGEACRRITEVGDPVLVVNSDKDAQEHQQALDFDRNDVWRILVGGAKLSRGFTVEGLTTTFYTRKALQGDTLMQAGRWFGFRRGYRDLVRLFIRRDPEGRPGRVDLYEAFEGLMRDEEAMRTDLRKYEGFDEDGQPVLEPWRVPAVVRQSLPYLRPTSRTKMFNAVIDSLGDAGRLKDYYGAPARIERADKRHNFALGARLLTAATDRLTFTAGRSKPEQPLSTFDALTGVVGAADVLEILRGLRWHRDYRDEVIAPTLRFYDKLASDGRLEDFVVVWPQLVRRVGTRNLPGVGDGQVVTRSRRTPPRLDFVGSDSKHRDALERIAGAADLSVPDTVADALRDNAGRRGAILLYVTGDLAAKKAEERATRPDELDADPDGADLVVLLSIVAPAAATPSGQAFIDWTVRRHTDWGSATVSST